MSLIKNISRIKNLESLQPDKRWEKTTKYDLLDEISSQNRLMQAHQLSNIQKVDLFSMCVFNQLAPSITKALTVFLIFMMFFGVNFAAQASVPGEPLWPVKRSIEEAEISLTFSPIKKTEVHIKHVNERLDEIDQILEVNIAIEGTEAQAQKNKAIQQAITHLEKDVTSVDSALKIVKGEKEALEVVELVKKVTDATKGVDNKLAEKKIEADNSNNTELGEALIQAKVLNKQVKKSAVAVAIEVHEEVKKTAEAKAILTTVKTTSTPEEILSTTETGAVETGTLAIIEPVELGEQEKLELAKVETISNIVKEIVASEINDLSLEVKDVKQKVEVVNQEDLEIIKQGAIGEVNNHKIVTSELDEIDVIKKESPADSEVVLQEAKVLLDNGMLRDAFEKVSEANEKYQKAEVTLEKIEKAIEEQKVDAEDVSKNQEPTVVGLPNTTTVTSSPTVITTSSPDIDIQSVENVDVIKASGVIDIVESEIIIK